MALYPACNEISQATNAARTWGNGVPSLFSEEEWLYSSKNQPRGNGVHLLIVGTVFP